MLLNSPAYAHSLPDKPPSEWHLLEDHLREVGNLTALFASVFGGEDLGRVAGLWHDLGKYALDFQEYLSQDKDASSQGRVDHSSAGAILANRRKMSLLSFIIAGHHSGLPNKNPLFANRLPTKQDRLLLAQANNIPNWIVDFPTFPIPSWVKSAHQTEFLGRMLFSCLIDADRLDTERFHNVFAFQERFKNKYDLIILRDLLFEKIKSLSSEIDTSVNIIRRQIVRDCKNAATDFPGFFSLTVPTGGGKTLSGMLFALEHAIYNNLDRIIIVIPYTSITEQTAQIYRNIFGADAVIEHHSAIEPQKDTDANRRACENWDAPIIVTTNVQLFETMFTNKTSKSRKLHRIANSVIILDEVQTLPIKYLDPILDGITELVKNYKSSIVFSTATQPAFSNRKIGKNNGFVCKEIIKDFKSIFNNLDRVMVKWPDDLNVSISWEEIVNKIKNHPQILVITHKRQDAQDLASLLPLAYHLSASMCPAHRSAILKKVQVKLKNKQPCILITTQVIEAGVDIDFPFVMRAFGPLDSLAQAAGRCNREGRLRNPSGSLIKGNFEIFISPSLPPQSTNSAISVTKLLYTANNNLSLSDPYVFKEYFDRLYEIKSTDEENIQNMRNQFLYEDVSQNFNLIDEGMMPIVIPYDDYLTYVNRLRYSLTTGKYERKSLRALQRYTINIPYKSKEYLLASGQLEQIGDLVDMLVPNIIGSYYDLRFGFIDERAHKLNIVEKLIL